MPDTIPNLWPAQIKVDVQTPYTILRVQAGLLAKLTRGILEGTVETESAKDKVQHRLVVIAPAWNGYRRTLITVRHQANLPYPATVEAESLGKASKTEPIASHRSHMVPSDDIAYPTASSDDQLQALVERALHSEQTTALILSLIANSNEASARSPHSGNGSPNGETGPK